MANLVRICARISTLLLFAALWLAPRVAEACPACAGQSKQFTSTLKAVAVFMLLPFLVVGVVLWVIRTASAAPAVPLDDQNHR